MNISTINYTSSDIGIAARASKRSAAVADLEDHQAHASKYANHNSVPETDSKEALPPSLPSVDLFTACGYQVSSKHELFKRIDKTHIQGIVTRLESIDLTIKNLEILVEGPYYHRSHPLFVDPSFFDYVLKAFLTGMIDEKTFHMLALYYGCLEASQIDSRCKIECFQLVDHENDKQAQKAKDILFLSFFAPLNIEKSSYLLSIEKLQNESPLDTQFFVLYRPQGFKDSLYEAVAKNAGDYIFNRWRWIGVLPIKRSQVILPPHLIDFVFKEKFGPDTPPLRPCFGFNPREPLSKGFRPFYLPSPEHTGAYAIPTKIDGHPFATQLAATHHDLFHAVIEAANVHKSIWIQLALYVKDKKDLFPNDSDRTTIFEIFLDRECRSYVYANNPCFAFWQSIYNLIISTHFILENRITTQPFITFVADFYVTHSLHLLPGFQQDPSIFEPSNNNECQMSALGREIILKIWTIIQQKLTKAPTAS